MNEWQQLCQLLGSKSQEQGHHIMIEMLCFPMLASHV